MTGIDENKYRLSKIPKGIQTGRERMYPAGSFFPLIQNDALAVMTLRSYAANVNQVLDWNVQPHSGEPLTHEQRAHLEQLGQDALDMAERWAKADDIHLPD